jgi:predicted DNA-binding transcriptional regulator YafY
MNRIDRISAILIQLQSRRVVKAQDISERFDISLRTVYRDLKTLEEAGVPLSGEAGIGYRILDGYKLPPIMFTREEALAFLTAGKLVDKLTDQATRKSFSDAMYKIKSVVRNSEKDYLENLEQHIAVLENPNLPKLAVNELHLQEILSAVHGKEVIEIGYTNVAEDKYTTRQLEPLGLFYLGRYWYLVSYCRLRNDYRHFRTDRISFIRKTNSFFHATHPSLESFIRDVKNSNELHEVVIKVDKNVLRYFGDQKYYNGFISEEDLGVQVQMTFLTSSLIGFSKFFMMFAEHADIVSPPELKSIILANMDKISNRLTK